MDVTTLCSITASVGNTPIQMRHIGVTLYLITTKFKMVREIQMSQFLERVLGGDLAKEGTRP